MMRFVLPLLVLLVSGCAKEPAAYHIAGSEIAITVERIKPYFWSSGWELDLIVRQHPNCQRRHHMKPTKSDKLKVEVYTPQRGVFILRQAKRWYVTDLRTCAMETFQDPPPEPGERVGAFTVKDGEFKFVPSQDRAATDNGAAEAE
ncbi:MAG: hypothetical protein HZA64_01585 [Rhodocyclales bacterium]|nr:hypothetical protein [Rhodocyclales bacterium]